MRIIFKFLLLTRNFIIIFFYMKKFYLESLGCPKNTSDSEFIIEKLIKQGYIYIKSYEDADTIIVNTCAFIKPAIDESVKLIKEYSRLNKDVIVTGCLVERFGKEIKGLHRKNIYFMRIKEIFNIKERFFIGENISRNYLEPYHYRYIKISDGCNHRCSFCSIPHIKGRYKSKPVEMVLNEIKSLPQSVKEIILIGQDTTKYGIDIYGKPMLNQLLKKLVKIFKGWIRILYLHPLFITDDLIEMISEDNNIVKYIDLPLQHISDNVLKSFTRGYDEKYVRRLIEKIRRRSNLFIRGTFIIGSPFEKDKDFKKLCEFVKENEIERICFFIYSPEEGTNLYRYGTLDKEIIKEREIEFQNLSFEIREKINERLLWKRIKILIDGKEDLYYGRTEYDAPEIDNIVYINQKVKIGEFEDVEIVSFADTFLFADRLQKGNKKRNTDRKNYY